MIKATFNHFGLDSMRFAENKPSLSILVALGAETARTNTVYDTTNHLGAQGALWHYRMVCSRVLWSCSSSTVGFEGGAVRTERAHGTLLTTHSHPTRWQQRAGTSGKSNWFCQAEGIYARTKAASLLSVYTASLLFFAFSTFALSALSLSFLGSTLPEILSAFLAGGV
eukprot:626578-Amphidinium_carterae.1